MAAYRRIKITANEVGKFYVDYSCIACEICTSIAPDNFRMKDDGSSSLIYKQPENGTEDQACEEAKNSCPADAIGDDGEL